MGMVRDTKKQTAREYDDAGGYNQTEKDEWTKEIYDTIVYVCKYAEGETNTSSCSDKNKKCKLGCSCPMSQWRKHMEEHVTKLLTLYAAGTINKPAGPTVPQFFEQLRGGGGPTSTCGWLLAEKSVESVGGCFVSLRICVKQVGCQVSGRVSGPQKSVEKSVAAPATMCMSCSGCYHCHTTHYTPVRQ
jgi:hypothetical protein